MGVRSQTGFTLLEVLLSSALLLILSAGFFSLLTGTFERSRVVDERQTVLERFVIFKEYCNGRLRNSRIETAQSTSEQMVFTAPVTASTSEGQLNAVGTNEMTVWDEKHRYHLKVKEVGGRVRAVEEVWSREDEDSEDWVFQGERTVWNFETTGSFEFNYDALPLMSIRCKTTLKRRGDDVPWDKVVTLTMSNYR